MINENELISEAEQGLSKIAIDYIKVLGFDSKGIPETNIKLEAYDYWTREENRYVPRS